MKERYFGTYFRDTYRFLKFFILLSALLPKGKSVRQASYVFNNEANVAQIFLAAKKPNCV